MVLSCLALLGCESWDDLAAQANCTDCDDGVGGGAGGGGPAGGSGGGLGGGSGGGTGGGTGGSGGGGALPLCSVAPAALCRLGCASIAGGMTCTVPGADALMRLAAGNFDTDGRTDFALLKPNVPGTTGLASGVYWLRNEVGGMDFSVSRVGTGSFPTGAAKLVVVSAVDGGRDALAVRASGERVFAWSPTPASGYTLVTDGGLASDISAARLPGWASDGLVTARDSTVSEIVSYPGLHSGSDFSLRNTKSGSSSPWNFVASWRNWLMLGTASTSSHFVTFSPDGGVAAVGSGLVSGGWIRALEMDLTGDGWTEFFMQRPSTYSVFDFPGGSVPVGQGSVGTSREVRFADAGLVPLGAAFTLGSLGASPATNLVTLGANGALRRFGNFTSGTDWVVTELPAIDAGAGFVAAQALLADVDGNLSNDLILVDAVGTIRILFFP